jgi:hypothetical protein
MPASPPRLLRLIAPSTAAALAACTLVVPLPGGNPDAGAGACRPVPVSRGMAAPQAIVALDRSSTMDERIEPLRAELIPALAALGRSVEIGYLQFPGDGCDDSTCCDASGVLVAPALNSAPAIDPLIACNPTGGACVQPGAHRTPTDDALQTIARTWAAPAPDADRFAVVITDGPPNCNGDTDAPCARAHRAAVDLWQSPSKVSAVILAIGPLTQGTCLDRIASDGGDVFGSGRPAAPPLVWIEDTTTPAVIRDALIQLLSPIRRRTCVVKLPAPRRRPGEVTVRAGDTLVPHDPTHADGWDFEPSRSLRPASELRLYGPRCDRVQDGTTAARTIKATITCEACGGVVACEE